MKNKYILIAIAIAAAGAIALELDTAEYRAAVNKFNDARQSDIFLQSQAEQVKELELSCLKFRVIVSKLAEHEKNYRACLINKLDNIKTAVSATSTAIEVRDFLDGKKEDAELTLKALDALKRGRANLESLYKPYYEVADAIALARNKSIFVRVFKGYMSEKGLFNFHADMLDGAEIDLINPSVGREQMRWRRDMFVASTK